MDGAESRVGGGGGHIARSAIASRTGASGGASIQEATRIAVYTDTVLTPTYRDIELSLSCNTLKSYIREYE